MYWEKGGGEAQCALPIFICENNRKSNKIMHYVEKKNLSGGCEERGILWAFFTNLPINL